MTVIALLLNLWNGAQVLKNPTSFSPPFSLVKGDNLSIWCHKYLLKYSLHNGLFGCCGNFLTIPNWLLTLPRFKVGRPSLPRLGHIQPWPFTTWRVGYRVVLYTSFLNVECSCGVLERLLFLSVCSPSTDKTHLKHSIRSSLDGSVADSPPQHCGPQSGYTQTSIILASYIGISLAL